MSDMAVVLIINALETMIIAKLTVDIARICRKMEWICKNTDDRAADTPSPFRKRGRKSARIADRSGKWLIEREKESRRR